MRNEIPHLSATLLCIEVILYVWRYPVIHSRVLFVRESLSLPDPDIFPCKSLFYRKVTIIWIGIYLWGIKSPPESMFGYLCPSVLWCLSECRRYVRNAEEVMWVEWGGQPHPLMLLTLGTETRIWWLHLDVPAGLFPVKINSLFLKSLDLAHL